MIEIIIAMLKSWEKVFLQKRTAQRAKRQAISQVCVMGRKTIARSYLARGESADWSAEYKIHKRSKWESEKLFTEPIKQVLAMSKGKYLALGCDDTRVKKSGKKIKSANWGRDAMSPPFQVNLQYGIRYLHLSALISLKEQEVNARAIPIAFKEVAPIKKPGKKATEEEKKLYSEEKKKHNLLTETITEFKRIRKEIDELGGKEKILAIAMDGSFCNKTIFKADLERTTLLARSRKDAKLCYKAKEGRKFYSEQKFTPLEIQQSQTKEWISAKVFHGGKFRSVEYKEVNNVLWQRGAGKKELRLMVVKPTPYRKTKKGKLQYREPAYLLTTDLEAPAEELLQIYFDRWQLEVAHKELKQDFGLGQAQLRVAQAVARQPILTVSTYSIMHLACLKAYGAHRPDAFLELPKYQKDKSRASCLDLIRFLRNEVINNPELFPFSLNISAQSLLDSSSC